MSDKSIMLIVAFVSVLCAIWAWFVPTLGMAVACIINAILSVFFAFKMEKTNV